MTKESIEAMDVNIFFSMVNMKLRDEYSSLKLLCEEWDVKEEDVTSKLSKSGYEYNIELNQFK